MSTRTDGYRRELDAAIERGAGASVNLIAARIAGDDKLSREEKLGLLAPRETYPLDPRSILHDPSPELTAFDNLVAALRTS